VKIVGGDVTEIVPPCASMIVLTLERPRPVKQGFFEQFLGTINDLL